MFDTKLTIILAAYVSRVWSCTLVLFLHQRDCIADAGGPKWRRKHIKWQKTSPKPLDKYCLLHQKTGDNRLRLSGLLVLFRQKLLNFSR